jgi:hypothetical protein
MAICRVGVLHVNIHAASAADAAMNEYPCAFRHGIAWRGRRFSGSVEPRGGTAL